VGEVIPTKTLLFIFSCMHTSYLVPIPCPFIPIKPNKDFKSFTDFTCENMEKKTRVEICR